MKSVACVMCSVSLRLKLFDAVVSPSLLYGLATAPVGMADLRRIDVVQRKMLRGIAGWVRRSPEAWATTMSRMKRRVDSALSHFPLLAWSDRIVQNKQELATRILLRPDDHWSRLAAFWRPDLIGEQGGQRKVGRPKLRWDSLIPASFRAV